MMWNEEKDRILLDLAKKHPHGNSKIAWRKVTKDPMWKWGPAAPYTLRDHYNKLLRERDKPHHISKPIVTKKPIIINETSSCPNCGTEIYLLFVPRHKGV